MRFTISAAVLAFASAAFAQTSGFDAMTSPAEGEQIPAGETYTVNWQPGTYTTGTVTLSLLGGATPSTLEILSTLASGVQNTAGTYTWTVDSSLGDLATYGIKISLDSDPATFQYSFPFQITESSSGSSSSSSAASSGYPTAATTSAVETYSALATETTTSASSSYAATTVSSSSFPSLTPSGTAGVSGIATGTGVSTVSTSTVKSSATGTSGSGSSSSTATPVATNGAPRAAAGVTAVLIGALAAVFAF